MWIYVVEQLDIDSECIVNAYTDEEDAKESVRVSNEQEQEKLRIYNEWATRFNEDEEDDDTPMPEFGDSTYVYTKVWLNGI